ncbi:NAD-dependent epimerase/dehydratase family protein [Nocardioides flavescens]|uniref:NAD-dependent epimerase/dehydratase family protein n=1 Tax=Nocardioides flavescens TaxID=2691959 RepID=A0A6L7F2A7_9ACTN|nr:NAD-dependent epimerase/dehydratase family protein [Nocardioides flavescens]MXG91331.1 NAD-dependent epimerase/dehydratase family protein [Nocardioides flavescens]
MSAHSPVHVVTGAGPVGSTVALQLAEAGEHVRLLTRSGSGPEHPLIDRRRVDVSQAGALTEAFAGAVAVHHCIHGSAYDARVWRAELPQAERAVLEAAGRVGAVVVFPESLYAYGPVDGPMTEDTPRAATSGKLGVRTELLAQRDASATPTVSVAASDFYGPAVRGAHAGERMVPTVLAGRTMRVLGSLDQPHSFTYVPDLAAAMIRAAGREDLWNSFLHAPTAAPVTQRRLVELVAQAGGVPVPRTASIPAWVFRASGAVSRPMREMAETAYMFDAPFVLDSSASEARLGLSPTPMVDGVAATVAWWRAQESAAA